MRPEQVEEIKKQIFEQVKDYPQEKKREIEEQIEKMTPDELEAFVREQMSRQGGAQQGQARQQPSKGIFRMIIDDEIPSRKIDENKFAVAVVSVRPVSKGHVLVIPKKPVADANTMPSQALSLAKKISRKIAAKLETSSTEIQTQKLFGEMVINIIPVYDKPANINSPSYEAGEVELDEVFKLLRVVKKPRVIRIKKEKPEEKALHLKRRIA